MKPLHKVHTTNNRHKTLSDLALPFSPPSGSTPKLNDQHLPSPMGGKWSWRTVRDIALRLGFRYHTAFVSTDELQARVNFTFKQHPSWTAQRIVANSGFECSVGIVRASAAIRRSRELVTKNH